MSDSMPTKDEIARRGREIYERDIRADVARDHDGEFLVVDVATGEYAEAKNPKGLFYLMRVGRPAVHRIGGSAWQNTNTDQAGWPVAREEVPDHGAASGQNERPTGRRIHSRAGSRVVREMGG